MKTTVKTRVCQFCEMTKPLDQLATKTGKLVTPIRCLRCHSKKPDGPKQIQEKLTEDQLYTYVLGRPLGKS